jgi:hypothetical protein
MESITSKRPTSAPSKITKSSKAKKVYDKSKSLVGTEIIEMIPTFR